MWDMPQLVQSLFVAVSSKFIPLSPYPDLNAYGIMSQRKVSEIRNSGF